jgi:transcriptional repressor NrdR
MVVEEIEAALRGTKMREVPADLIGALVMEKLKSLDHVAYIRFASVYRDFADVESFQREVKELLHAHPQSH